VKRLIAVGVIDSWEGDWQAAQGNELAVVAYPVGVGETVHLEVADKEGIAWIIPLSEGIAALISEKKISRYRVVKNASGAVDSKPTTVEMILGNVKTPTHT
jgi:hypothetical protein